MRLALVLTIFLTVLATHARMTSPAEGVDIRSLAPLKPVGSDPSPIAVPQSGSDLGSISADWARRQLHVSSHGDDERFLIDANEKLDRFFSPASNDRSENIEGASAAGRAPSSENWLTPKTVHFSGVGEIEVGFRSQTKFSCDLAGSNGTELNLSRPVTGTIDLRLHHELRDSLSAIQLQLNW